MILTLTGNIDESWYQVSNIDTSYSIVSHLGLSIYFIVYSETNIWTIEGMDENDVFNWKIELINNTFVYHEYTSEYNNSYVIEYDKYTKHVMNHYVINMDYEKNKLEFYINKVKMTEFEIFGYTITKSIRLYGDGEFLKYMDEDSYRKTVIGEILFKLGKIWTEYDIKEMFDNSLFTEPLVSHRFHDDTQTIFLETNVDDIEVTGLNRHLFLNKDLSLSFTQINPRLNFYDIQNIQTVIELQKNKIYKIDPFSRREGTYDNDMTVRIKVSRETYSWSVMGCLLIDNTIRTIAWRFGNYIIDDGNEQILRHMFLSDGTQFDGSQENIQSGDYINPFNSIIDDYVIRQKVDRAGYNYESSNVSCQLFKNKHLVLDYTGTNKSWNSIIIVTDDIPLYVDLLEICHYRSYTNDYIKNVYHTIDINDNFNNEVRQKTIFSHDFDLADTNSKWYHSDTTIRKRTLFENRARILKYNEKITRFFNIYDFNIGKTHKFFLITVRVRSDVDYPNISKWMLSFSNNYFKFNQIIEDSKNILRFTTFINNNTQTYNVDITNRIEGYFNEFNILSTEQNYVFFMNGLFLQSFENKDGYQYPSINTYSVNDNTQDSLNPQPNIYYEKIDFQTGNVFSNDLLLSEYIQSPFYSRIQHQGTSVIYYNDSFQLHIPDNDNYAFADFKIELDEGDSLGILPVTVKLKDIYSSYLSISDIAYFGNPTHLTKVIVSDSPVSWKMYEIKKNSKTYYIFGLSTSSNKNVWLCNINNELYVQTEHYNFNLIESNIADFSVVANNAFEINPVLLNYINTFRFFFQIPNSYTVTQGYVYYRYVHLRFNESNIATTDESLMDSPPYQIHTPAFMEVINDESSTFYKDGFKRIINKPIGFSFYVSTTTLDLYQTDAVISERNRSFKMWKISGYPSTYYLQDAYFRWLNQNPDTHEISLTDHFEDATPISIFTNNLTFSFQDPWFELNTFLLILPNSVTINRIPFQIKEQSYNPYTIGETTSTVLDTHLSNQDLYGNICYFRLYSIQEMSDMYVSIHIENHPMKTTHPYVRLGYETTHLTMTNNIINDPATWFEWFHTKTITGNDGYYIQNGFGLWVQMSDSGNLSAQSYHIENATIFLPNGLFNRTMHTFQENLFHVFIKTITNEYRPLYFNSQSIQTGFDSLFDSPSLFEITNIVDGYVNISSSTDATNLWELKTDLLGYGSVGSLFKFWEYNNHIYIQTKNNGWLKSQNNDIIITYNFNEASIFTIRGHIQYIESLEQAFDDDVLQPYTLIYSNVETFSYFNVTHLYEKDRNKYHQNNMLIIPNHSYAREEYSTELTFPGDRTVRLINGGNHLDQFSVRFKIYGSNWTFFTDSINFVYTNNTFDCWINTYPIITATYTNITPINKLTEFFIVYNRSNTQQLNLYIDGVLQNHIPFISANGETIHTVTDRLPDITYTGIVTGNNNSFINVELLVHISYDKDQTSTISGGELQSMTNLANNQPMSVHNYTNEGSSVSELELNNRQGLYFKYSGVSYDVGGSYADGFYGGDGNDLFVGATAIVVFNNTNKANLWAKFTSMGSDGSFFGLARHYKNNKLCIQFLNTSYGGDAESIPFDFNNTNDPNTYYLLFGSVQEIAVSNIEFVFELWSFTNTTEEHTRKTWTDNLDLRTLNHYRGSDTIYHCGIKNSRYNSNIRYSNINIFESRYYKGCVSGDFKEFTISDMMNYWKGNPPADSIIPIVEPVIIISYTYLQINLNLYIDFFAHSLEIDDVDELARIVKSFTIEIAGYRVPSIDRNIILWNDSGFGGDWWTTEVTNNNLFKIYYDNLDITTNNPDIFVKSTIERHDFRHIRLGRLELKTELPSIDNAFDFFPATKEERSHIDLNDFVNIKLSNFKLYRNNTTEHVRVLFDHNEQLNSVHSYQIYRYLNLSPWSSKSYEYNLILDDEELTNVDFVDMYTFTTYTIDLDYKPNNLNTNKDIHMIIQLSSQYIRNNIIQTYNEKRLYIGWWDGTDQIYSSTNTGQFILEFSIYPQQNTSSTTYGVWSKLILWNQTDSIKTLWPNKFGRQMELKFDNDINNLLYSYNNFDDDVPSDLYVEFKFSQENEKSYLEFCVYYGSKKWEFSDFNGNQIVESNDIWKPINDPDSNVHGCFIGGVQQAFKDISSIRLNDRYYNLKDQSYTIYDNVTEFVDSVLNIDYKPIARVTMENMTYNFIISQNGETYVEVYGDLIFYRPKANVNRFVMTLGTHSTMMDPGVLKWAESNGSFIQNTIGCSDTDSRFNFNVVHLDNPGGTVFYKGHELFLKIELNEANNIILDKDEIEIVLCRVTLKLDSINFDKNLIQPREGQHVQKFYDTSSRSFYTFIKILNEIDEDGNQIQVSNPKYIGTPVDKMWPTKNVWPAFYGLFAVPSEWSTFFSRETYYFETGGSIEQFSGHLIFADSHHSIQNNSPDLTLRLNQPRNLDIYSFTHELFSSILFKYIYVDVQYSIKRVSFDIHLQTPSQFSIDNISYNQNIYITYFQYNTSDLISLQYTNNLFTTTFTLYDTMNTYILRLHSKDGDVITNMKEYEVRIRRNESNEFHNHFSIESDLESVSDTTKLKYSLTYKINDIDKLKNEFHVNDLAKVLVEFGPLQYKIEYNTDSFIHTYSDQTVNLSDFVVSRVTNTNNGITTNIATHETVVDNIDELKNTIFSLHPQLRGKTIRVTFYRSAYYTFLDETLENEQITGWFELHNDIQLNITNNAPDNQLCDIKSIDFKYDAIQTSLRDDKNWDTDILNVAYGNYTTSYIITGSKTMINQKENVNLTLSPGFNNSTITFEITLTNNDSFILISKTGMIWNLNTPYNEVTNVYSIEFQRTTSNIYVFTCIVKPKQPEYKERNEDGILIYKEFTFNIAFMNYNNFFNYYQITPSHIDLFIDYNKTAISNGINNYEFKRKNNIVSPYIIQYNNTDIKWVITWSTTIQYNVVIDTEYLIINDQPDFGNCDFINDIYDNLKLRYSVNQLIEFRYTIGCEIKFGSESIYQRFNEYSTLTISISKSDPIVPGYLTISDIIIQKQEGEHQIRKLDHSDSIWLVLLNSFVINYHIELVLSNYDNTDPINVNVTLQTNGNKTDKRMNYIGNNRFVMYDNIQTSDYNSLTKSIGRIDILYNFLNIELNYDENSTKYNSASTNYQIYIRRISFLDIYNSIRFVNTDRTEINDSFYVSPTDSTIITLKCDTSILDFTFNAAIDDINNVFQSIGVLFINKLNIYIALEYTSYRLKNIYGSNYHLRLYTNGPDYTIEFTLTPSTITFTVPGNYSIDKIYSRVSYQLNDSLYYLTTHNLPEIHLSVTPYINDDGYTYELDIQLELDSYIHLKTILFEIKFPITNNLQLHHSSEKQQLSNVFEITKNSTSDIIEGFIHTNISDRSQINESYQTVKISYRSNTLVQYPGHTSHSLFKLHTIQSYYKEWNITQIQTRIDGYIPNPYDEDINYIGSWIDEPVTLDIDKSRFRTFNPPYVDATFIPSSDSSSFVLPDLPFISLNINITLNWIDVKINNVSFILDQWKYIVFDIYLPFNSIDYILPDVPNLSRTVEYKISQTNVDSLDILLPDDVSHWTMITFKYGSESLKSIPTENEVLFSIRTPTYIEYWTRDKVKKIHTKFGTQFITPHGSDNDFLNDWLNGASYRVQYTTSFFNISTPYISEITYTSSLINYNTPKIQLYIHENTNSEYVITVYVKDISTYTVRTIMFDIYFPSSDGNTRIFDDSNYSITTLFTIKSELTSEYAGRGSVYNTTAGDSTSFIIPQGSSSIHLVKFGVQNINEDVQISDRILMRLITKRQFTTPWSSSYINDIHTRFSTRIEPLTDNPTDSIGIDTTFVNEWLLGIKPNNEPRSEYVNTPYITSIGIPSIHLHSVNEIQYNNPVFKIIVTLNNISYYTPVDMDYILFDIYIPLKVEYQPILNDLFTVSRKHVDILNVSYQGYKVGGGSTLYLSPRMSYNGNPYIYDWMILKFKVQLKYTITSGILFELTSTNITWEDKYFGIYDVVDNIYSRISTVFDDPLGSTAHVNWLNQVQPDYEDQESYKVIDTPYIQIKNIPISEYISPPIIQLHVTENYNSESLNFSYDIKVSFIFTSHLYPIDYILFDIYFPDIKEIIDGSISSNGTPMSDIFVSQDTLSGLVFQSQDLAIKTPNPNLRWYVVKCSVNTDNINSGDDIFTITFQKRYVQPLDPSYIDNIRSRFDIFFTNPLGSNEEHRTNWVNGNEPNDSYHASLPTYINTPYTRAIFTNPPPTIYTKTIEFNPIGHDENMSIFDVVDNNVDPVSMYIPDFYKGQHDDPFLTDLNGVSGRVYIDNTDPFSNLRVTSDKQYYLSILNYDSITPFFKVKKEYNRSAINIPTDVDLYSIDVVWVSGEIRHVDPYESQPRRRLGLASDSSFDVDQDIDDDASSIVLDGFFQSYRPFYTNIFSSFMNPSSVSSILEDALSFSLTTFTNPGNRFRLSNNRHRGLTTNSRLFHSRLLSPITWVQETIEYESPVFHDVNDALGNMISDVISATENYTPVEDLLSGDTSGTIPVETGSTPQTTSQTVSLDSSLDLLWNPVIREFEYRLRPFSEFSLLYSFVTDNEVVSETDNSNRLFKLRVYDRNNPDKLIQYLKYKQTIEDIGLLSRLVLVPSFEDGSWFVSTAIHFENQAYHDTYGIKLQDN